jgi:hypothetical protein
VKEEYQLQLKLYAGLFEEVYGKYPNKLILQSLNGSTADVEFTEKECKALMLEARNLFDEINKIILSKDEDTQKFESLAKPGSVSCHFCMYRPACGPYLKHLASNPHFENSIQDVCGTLEEQVELGNGKLMFAMKRSDGVKVVIRGISRERYQELPKPDERFTAFSVKRERVEGNFTEWSLTTIYKL